MPTPAEDIAILNSFFQSELPTNPGTRPDGLYRAEAAMADLSWQAAVDASVRLELAEALILEQSLRPQTAIKEHQALYSADGAIKLRERDDGEVRLTLLDAIYDASTGGLFTDPDPSGIASWIGSAAAAQDYFLNALVSDPSADVVAALFRIVQQVALPVKWLRAMMTEDVFNRARVRISESNWTASERTVLGALVRNAQGRVVRDLGGPLPTGAGIVFKTANGDEIEVTPPPSKPWYRRGWSLLGIGAGMTGGAVIAAHRKR